MTIFPNLLLQRDFNLQIKRALSQEVKQPVHNSAQNEKHKLGSPKAKTQENKVVSGYK